MHIRELQHVMEKAKRDRHKLVVDRRRIVDELEDIEDELKDLDRFIAILKEPELLIPCSSVARASGCTCEMSVVHSTDIVPPEPVIARNCPLHGSEPDEDEPPRSWEEARDMALADIAATSDEEDARLHAAALADPDNPPLPKSEP